MKRLVLLLIFGICINIAPIQAYYFATDVETEVTQLDSNHIEFTILRHDDEDDEEVYPIGTKLYGSLFEYRERKRALRDEFIRVHIDKATLPNGGTETVNKDIKLRPRVFMSAQYAVAGIGSAAAITMKFAIDFLAVGFPAGRGSKALTDMAFAIYNTPKFESKWKEGSKGFVKGIFSPLTELVIKGDELPVHIGSHVWIQDAQEHKKNLTAFLIKRKNLFLTNEKYYSHFGGEPITFGHLLSDKDKAKQAKKDKKKAEKLAKKRSKAVRKREKKQKHRYAFKVQHLLQEEAIDL